MTTLKLTIGITITCGWPIHLQKRFYLKSRSRDFVHAPFGVFHHPLCSTCRGLSNKEQELSYRKQIARQLHKH